MKIDKSTKLFQSNGEPFLIFHCPVCDGEIEGWIPEEGDEGEGFTCSCGKSQVITGRIEQHLGHKLATLLYGSGKYELEVEHFEGSVICCVVFKD